MRRLLFALPLLVAVPALAGCRSSRDDARRQFTEQLETEGGLSHSVAVCIVDKFFEERTTEELKAFFERKDLTAEESAEFKTLGEQCAVLDTTPVTAAGV